MLSIAPHNTSMIVAFDGESKCGKTTFADEVAQGAQWQKDLYRGAGLPDDMLQRMYAEPAMEIISHTGFNGITTISAGNVFRAAALYTLNEEKQGRVVDGFSPQDAPRLRSMLKEDGVIDILQNDDEVGRRVSRVAKFAGVQALCGTLFCDSIQEAYFADDGHNLVIVDARDPVGHMKRNNLLGNEKGKILPLSVISAYVDTPIHVAASRMSGDLDDNVRLVTERRHADATRAELPVLPPAVTTPIREWFELMPYWDGSTITSLDESLPPLHIQNGEESSLEYVKYVGDILAASATMASFAIDAYLNPHNIQMQFNFRRHS